MKKNYYEVLEVNQDATEEEIRKKYKELVRKYHPDVCKDEDATERVTEINVAYDTLSDEAKRKKYDESLKNNTTYEDTVEQQEQPFDYEEEIKNYTEKEKAYAKKIAIEKVIKEELAKITAILDARIEVIQTCKTVDNIIEDYYFDQVEKWWELADNYINNLDKLRIEAETNNLDYLIDEINLNLNKLNEEMQGMPLTILDAEEYIKSRENKERVLAQLSRDIQTINTLLKTNSSLYDQIIMGFINEKNYDRYKESRIYEIDKAIGKMSNMKKLSELYNLDSELHHLENLENYIKKLKKQKKKIPKDYETAKKKAEYRVFYKEREQITDEVRSIIDQLRLFKSRMQTGVGNIVTLKEIKDITARYTIAKAKLSTLERKQARCGISPENRIPFDINSKILEYAYNETIDLRNQHIEEFFKTYSESLKRKNIGGLLLHDNVSLSGICLLNGVAATLHIIAKNYITITIPITIVLTGYNVHSLKEKYAIYKHNYKKGNMIINNDSDTKEEYKKYCLRNNIKIKTP